MNTYYKKKLYPLQDKVLKKIEDLKIDFYLTGGTALSRCYYHHRFSDDLDLFLNNDPKFTGFSNKIRQTLERKHALKIINRSDDFFSFTADNILKIDLVNDVRAHIGNFNKCNIFKKTDNVINILSNKISSLISREEPKDVADIWIIWKSEKIDWEKIFTDVSSKAAGIFPPQIAKKLEDFPIELLSKIKWQGNKKPAKKDFQRDILKITKEILKLD